MPPLFGRCFVLGTSVLLLLAASGCRRPESPVERGNRTQTFHLGNGAEPPDLDPHTNNSASVSWIEHALFEGLVDLASDGTTIQPGVAERWEVSADGLTYTFHLRSDAKWSNGERVTADDFVAGLHRFLEPQLGCEGVNIVFSVVGARDFVEGRNKDFSSVGIRVIDTRTLEYRLNYPAPYFLSVLANSRLVPVYQPALDKFQGRVRRGSAWTQPGNLISNGPFILKEWRPHVAVVVEKNPRYWDAARVRLNEIYFHPIEDTAAEERAFRTGQLHVTFTVPNVKLPSYLERRAPELRLAPVLRSDFITFSTSRPPFADLRVRRAFSLAIDREQLLNTVLKGRGEPSYSYVRSGVGGYTLDRFFSYDPQEAKNLIRAAGFPDGAGFPAVELMLSSRSEDILTYGQALQQMWQHTLGIRVQLVPTEHKVWLDALRSKSFAITTDNWNMAIDDPLDMLALAVTGDPNNDAGWSNARYDAEFKRVLSEPSPSLRREAMIACEQLLAEEVPYAPIFHATRARLVHPAVQGWRDNAIQQVDWKTLSLAEK